MDLGQVFQGEGQDRIGRILAQVKRLQEIESAVSTIRYNDELVTEVPDLLKALGAAKDAAIAGLKTA